MAVTRRRGTTVLAAAAATAVALGTGALTLPTASAAAPAAGAPAIKLKDGTLDWGVKESFRKYLLSPVAHGRITTGDGATQAEGNGPFTFQGGTGTYDTGSHGTHTAFNGSVRFEGHEGALDIELSDLQVTTTTTGGGISADVTTVADGKATTDQDVVIADLSLAGVRPGTGAGGAMVFQNIPATLTAAGSKAFQGFYQAGAALDAATLTVTPVTEEPTPTPEPSTDPSTEPSPEPSTDPSTEPSPEPSTDPSTDPSTGPGTDPGTTPSPTPSADPSAAPGDQDTDPDAVAKGVLTWGLKESWRTYIATGGGSEVSGGAKKDGEVFAFPYASGSVDADAEKADVAFDGGVRFTYKAHGIDMEFSDVKVVASGTKGTLTLDVKTPQGTKDDVDFAKLDLSSASYAVKDDVVTLSQVPAAFTAAGAAAFANDTTGSFYKAGDALDPVTISLALSDDADLSPVGAGDGGGTGSGTGAGAAGTGGGASGSGFGAGAGTASLASTGAGLPTGQLLGGAGAVVAAGAGALYLARRRRDTPAERA